MKLRPNCSNLTVLSSFALAIALAGCSGHTLTGPAAVAEISPTSVAASSGMSPRGSVRFTQLVELHPIVIQ